LALAHLARSLVQAAANPLLSMFPA
jgi:hypothetical protein